MIPRFPRIDTDADNRQWLKWQDPEQRGREQINVYRDETGQLAAQWLKDGMIYDIELDDMDEFEPGIYFLRGLS